jgi:hypothetical protein
LLQDYRGLPIRTSAIKRGFDLTLTKEVLQQTSHRGAATLKRLIVTQNRVTLVDVPLRLQKGIHHISADGQQTVK